MTERNTLLRKAAGLIRLLRPDLSLTAGVCVVIGEALVLRSLPPVNILASGFALGFLLSASALVFNDFFDVAVDQINAPERPLPSGLLTRRDALALAALTALAGLAIAASISLQIFLISLAVWALGFVYNWKLKSAGLWGNLAVGISVGMTFLLGGFLAGQPWRPLVLGFAALVLLFDLAEEIAADAMDIEGDRARSSRSIAIRLGKTAALRITCLLFALVIGLSILLTLVSGVHWVGLLIISAVDLVLLFFLLRLVRSHTPAEGHRAIRGLYLSGSAGLLAILVVILVL